MKALASGTPEGGYIRIQPNAFEDADLYGLATALVHEASHLMEQPTVDYAYRKGGLFHEPTAAPAYGSSQAKALLVLRFKVTRAWVRANELTSPGPGRIPVVGLIHADPYKVGVEVTSAMFKALFAAMEAVMTRVQRHRPALAPCANP